jgi:DNA-binding NarL/FixJ family response regulator
MVSAPPRGSRWPPEWSSPTAAPRTPSSRAARLAADGLTNREIAQHLFVTQKTIETQLRAAYRKLDVPGRGELAAALDG